MTASNAYSSIQRNLRLLRAIADGNHRFEDIKANVDLPASSINRILKGLVSVKLAYQDPETRHYYLGPEVLRLSSDPLTTHQMLISICHDELGRISLLAGETTVLFIPQGIKRIVLATIPSPHEVTLLYKPGLTNLIHLGSGGKMLLAMMDQPRVDKILTAIESSFDKQKAKLDKVSLLDELKEIKKQGYSTSRGEWIQGCNGLSVPLWGYAVPVSLGLMGPDYRVETKDYRRELQESSHKLSRILREVHPQSA